jgi:hypothetical protein
MNGSLAVGPDAENLRRCQGVDGEMAPTRPAALGLL